VLAFDSTAGNKNKPHFKQAQKLAKR